jgi:hypothetical protein
VEGIAVKRTPVAQAVISQSLRALIAPQVAPIGRYAPILAVPVCLHCGRQHPVALLCPPRAWAEQQQKKGKTP